VSLPTHSAVKGPYGPCPTAFASLPRAIASDLIFYERARMNCLNGVGLFALITAL